MTLAAEPAAGADLAANRPGALSAQRARELTRAAPVGARMHHALRRTDPLGTLRGVADAEQRVGLALDRLDPSWRVLHSVPIGPAHPVISHLVIGSGGVFTLLSRRHRRWRRDAASLDRVVAMVDRDELYIDGLALPYLPQARAQAWRAARALSAAIDEPVHVRPAVVLVGCDDVRFHALPDGVEVLTRARLVRRLTAFPPVLTAAQVEQRHETARAGATWADAPWST
ncbi:MAG TPA: nuclease-related domain-containing protein [Sporichthyaceae bacterium]